MPEHELGYIQTRPYGRADRSSAAYPGLYLFFLCCIMRVLYADPYQVSLDHRLIYDLFSMVLILGFHLGMLCAVHS